MAIAFIPKRNVSSLHRQRQKVGLLFSLPALALVAAFLGLPIYQAMYYSMTQWNGIIATWIGPSAYIDEFKDPIFWRVIENNALLLGAVPIAILIPMGIAYMLNDKVIGWKFFRTVYFLPTAISWVVIGMVSMRFFAQQGLLNGRQGQAVRSDRGSLPALAVRGAAAHLRAIPHRCRALQPGPRRRL